MINKLELGLISLTLSLGACAAKIYVVDRQTVLEQEAAGDWPQFDAQLYEKTASAGPLPFPKVPPSPNQGKLYKVLNGELVTEAQKK